MNNYYIYTNNTKDIDGQVTAKVKEYLLSKGVNVVCDIEQDIDIVIVIGGDGTFIRAAGELAGRDVLFTGINLGTLGFLTEIETDNIEACLDRIIAGEYEVDERIMLELMGSDERPSLNDIVISRSGALQVVEYRLFVNDKFLVSFRSDGIIISTPTGSTGYNFSAGGPIMEPYSQVVAITPISPQNFTARSVVLCADDVIGVECYFRKETGGVSISFDGQGNIPVKIGERMNISVSKKLTKFIRLSQESFVTVLSKKFNV